MRIFILVFVSVFYYSCQAPQSVDDRLPILGNKDIVGKDTTYHTIPSFEFINQYGEKITENTFKDKAYIVDYFFTSCPTICPKVKDQELRIFEKYKDHDKLSLLSVSMDTKFDTIGRLHWFAEKLEIPKSNWHFVTGEEDLIYSIDEEFFHIAEKDEDAPGGFNHDGRLILIDKKKHIRSFCNGLDEKDVDRFMLDIEKLLNE